MTYVTQRVVALAIALTLMMLPNAFAAPKKSLTAKPSVEETLTGLPYVEISEVLTLSPKDQDAFTTIILSLRGKYRIGFSRLPKKYLNVPDTDTALLQERQTWLSHRDEQLERFSVEAIQLRRDFGLISQSQASFMKKVVREGEVSKIPVMISATGTAKPGRNPPPPPAPKCGGFTAPSDKVSTYVCVCPGTPKAGWELATQNITSVHPCTGESYVKTQITNEWVSQTSARGDCMHLYKSEKSIYSNVVKAPPLNCRGDQTPVASPTCGVNQTTTTINHANTNCPRGSKSAVKDVRTNSTVTVTAIPPTCQKRDWTYTKKSDSWTSTYNCDLTCTGCRNDEVVGP
jgi:hypothetical protein